VRGMVGKNFSNSLGEGALFSVFWRLGLADYYGMECVAWSWQSIDGAICNGLMFGGEDHYIRIPGEDILLPEYLADLVECDIPVWFNADQITTDQGIAPFFHYCTDDPCTDIEDVANNGLTIELGHSPPHSCIIVPVK